MDSSNIKPNIEANSKNIPNDKGINNINLSISLIYHIKNDKNNYNVESIKSIILVNFNS